MCACALHTKIQTHHSCDVLILVTSHSLHLNRDFMSDQKHMNKKLVKSSFQQILWGQNNSSHIIKSKKKLTVIMIAFSIETLQVTDVAPEEKLHEAG